MPPSDEVISKLQRATYTVTARLGHEIGPFNLIGNPFFMKKIYEHGRRHSEMVKTVPG